MHPAWLPLLTDLILAKLGIALQSFSKEKRSVFLFLKRKSILVNIFLKKIYIILHLKYYCSFNFFCYQLMQNYFRTLYFTISLKTTAVPYAIPFYKMQRREGSLHFFRYCSIYDSLLTKYLYAIHYWQVLLLYLTLSWIICITFTHYIQSWTSSPGLNNMYINKGILL